MAACAVTRTHQLHKAGHNDHQIIQRLNDGPDSPQAVPGREWELDAAKRAVEAELRNMSAEALNLHASDMRLPDTEVDRNERLSSCTCDWVSSFKPRELARESAALVCQLIALVVLSSQETPGKAKKGLEKPCPLGPCCGDSPQQDKEASSK